MSHIRAVHGTPYGFMGSRVRSCSLSLSLSLYSLSVFIYDRRMMTGNRARVTMRPSRTVWGRGKVSFLLSHIQDMEKTKTTTTANRDTNTLLFSPHPLSPSDRCIFSPALTAVHALIILFVFFFSPRRVSPFTQDVITSLSRVRGAHTIHLR